MRTKPVIPRQRAVRDVDEVIDHYLREGAEQAALGFLDALEGAYRHIGANPATGSTRYAHELGLPGLRCWPLARYPHLVSSSSAMITSTSGGCSTVNGILPRGCRTRRYLDAISATTIRAAQLALPTVHLSLARGPFGPGQGGRIHSDACTGACPVRGNVGFDKHRMIFRVPGRRLIQPLRPQPSTSIVPKVGIIIPSMGTSLSKMPKLPPAQGGLSVADALFTGTQQRVLGLLFGQPARSFYATEVIGLAGMGSGAVQRELARLVPERAGDRAIRRQPATLPG